MLLNESEFKKQFVLLYSNSIRFNLTRPIDIEHRITTEAKKVGCNFISLITVNKNTFLVAGVDDTITHEFVILPPVLFKPFPVEESTALIKALASHYNLGICIINLSGMSDDSFQNAIATAPSGCIILIEDFDSAKATKQRLPNVSADPASILDIEQLTLSGILNTLDGIISLESRLVFLTTNVLDTIDAALIRKGRVDYIFELPALTDTEIRSYIALMWPDHYVPDRYKFKDILGCDIQSLYFEHRDNVDAFIQNLPKE